MVERKIDKTTSYGEELFAGIVETAIDAIITIDENGTIETFSRAAERQFGYSSEEVVGKNLKILMPEPFHSEHDGYLKNYKETGKRKIIGFGREVVGKRKNGTTFFLHLSVSEAFLRGRRMFVGIGRDISSLKEAEAKLKESESRTRAVVENAVDGIITITRRGIVQAFNSSAVKLFGYSPEEVIGKNVSILMPMPFRDEHDGYLANYLSTGFRKIIGIGREVTARRSDGTTLPVHLSVSEFKVGDDIYFTGMLRDLSDIKQMQAQLKESEDKSRSVLETAVDSIITIDAKGLVQSLNPSAAKQFGYEPHEVLGKNVSMLMPAPYKAEHDQYLKNYLATGARKIIGSGREVLGLRKDGSEFPIHLSVSEYKAGDKTLFAGIARDITAIKAAERAIRDQNEQLSRQNWFQEGLVQLGNVMRGKETVVDLCSGIINTLCGYTNINVGIFYLACQVDKVLYMVAGHAFPANKSKKVRVPFNEGISGQTAFHGMMSRLSPGENPPLMVNSSFIDFVPKDILAIPVHVGAELIGVLEFASIQPIKDTDLQFLNAVCEPIGLAIQSVQGQVKVKALLDQTQRQAEELRQQQTELRASNEELQSQQEELAQANAALQEQRTQLEDKKRSLQALNDDLRLSKNAIEEKARELEVASRYKSEFLASMSHELRTPLNSILILSQILASNEDDSMKLEDIEHAKTIYSSGADLLNLINDVLDLSKIEAGKLDLEIETIALVDVAESMRRAFQAQFDAKRIQFKITINPALPNSIHVDRHRLEQILKNFLSNALKFTERGSVELAFEEATPLEAKKSVAISVKDSGIGIAEEDKPLIFKAFQQLDSGTSKKYGGTGLGLSIARNLAKRMGGQVAFDSKLGQGSIFTLVVPETCEGPAQIVKGPANTIESRGSRHASPWGNASEGDDRAKIKKGDRIILIVEDDPNFSKILYDFCRLKGFLCLRDFTGERTLADALELSPSAILLDVGLPNVNGLTILDQLKTNDKTKHIPVHVISAMDAKVESLSRGAFGFMSKPVSKDAVEKVLTQIEALTERRTKKILFVEDNLVERNAIERLLSKREIQISGVDSAMEALALLKSDHFDCVILDLKLAHLSGFEFLKELEKDTALPKPPIIVYTGKELSKDERQQLEQLTQAIVIKGEKSPELLLDEVTLFLRNVDATSPRKKRKAPAKRERNEKILQGKKILIVDDDIRNVYALRSLLVGRGLELVTATNGKEALNLLDQHPNMNLVLMDIMMPEMDGYQTIHEIRKSKKKLPIIALTAKAMKGDREKCLDVGANDYLPKPLDSDHLLSLMRIWLS